MRAELLVNAVLVALAEKIKVLLAQRRQKTIGIEELPDLAARIGRAELVAEKLGALRDEYLEHALGRDPSHGEIFRRLRVELDNLARHRAAEERAHQHALAA